MENLGSSRWERDHFRTPSQPWLQSTLQSTPILHHFRTHFWPLAITSEHMHRCITYSSIPSIGSPCAQLAVSRLFRTVQTSHSTLLQFRPHILTFDPTVKKNKQPLHPSLTSHKFLCRKDSRPACVSCQSPSVQLPTKRTATLTARKKIAVHNRPYLNF